MSRTVQTGFGEAVGLRWYGFVNVASGRVIGIVEVAEPRPMPFLYLDDAGRMREQTRLNFDSTAHPPEGLRGGTRLSSAGSPATVLVDPVWLTESELSP